MKEKFDEKELDQLFHDKLSGGEIAPREIVWTKISQELGGTGKRPVAWIWWLSGIILILVTGTWFGISAYQKNTLAQNKTATGFKNDPVNGGFDKVPYDYNGGDTGLIQIEGGTFTKGKVESSGTENKNGYDELNKSKTNDLDPNRPYDPGVNDSKEKSSLVKSSNGKHPDKRNDISEPLVAKEKKNAKEVPVDYYTGIRNDEPSAGKPFEAIPDPKNPLENNSILPGLENNSKLPEEKAVPPIPQEKIVLPAAAPSPAKASEPEQKDSVPAKKETDPVVKNDSDTTPGPDVSNSIPDGNSESPLPDYFATVHAGIEAGKIISSESNEYAHNAMDVRIYNPDKLKSLPQQTYSYGARFGWFISKRISLTAGAYYSIFETNTNDGNLVYNHNGQYSFNMHSPTASVHCSSLKFDRNDSYGPLNDSFYIHLQSHEKYEYVNFQLGASFYAVRKKHFGVYGTLLSNEAFLSKEYMTLFVPHSGKTLSYSGKQLYGMNKFVLGAQTGIGFEWLPIGNLGLWIEPSFYFSGKINAKNAVSLHPGGVKCNVGIAYHF